MNIILRNNTGSKDKQELISGFVIRTKPFKLIFQEIAGSVSDKPEQSYLIIGQRGAGKTTLLYRLKYEIEDALKEKLGIIPLMLSEEQYNLSDLADLWQNVAELLEEHQGFDGLSKSMSKFSQKPSYEESALFLLEDKLKQAGKKIILFIENIDAFFKKIGKSGQKRLREVLMSSAYIRFICSATTYFEAITDYSMPFYGFFKVIELKGLNRLEARELLLKIGEEYGQKEKIVSVIKKSPKRLESLRRLTGGVPRMISYLFDIFLDNENGKAIKDLYRLIDDLTFLYKSELDQLSAQQQKVIDVIAKNWDAIAVKDIVERTRFESKQVSAILQALEKNQVVEKVSTKSKNNLYRVRERFMNIWYLMRFGKAHEKENVIWLVRFYDAWCDRTELANHINKHLQNLADGKYDVNVALYMGNTFLRCENVPEDLRYNIYKSTRAVWPKNSITALQYSDKDLYQRIKQLIKKHQYKEAIEVLQDIQDKTGEYYLFSSFVYGMSKDYIKAEEDAEKYFDSDPSSGPGAYRVGVLNWQYLNNTEKATKYLIKALELKEYKAAMQLGDIYFFNENLDEALIYYLQADQHNLPGAYMPIATIYFNQKKYTQAEEYCHKAIQSNVTVGYLNMGVLQEIKGDLEGAKRSYETALEKGENAAFLSLANLELEKSEPNIGKAINYTQQAYKQKVEGAAIALAKIYLDQIKLEDKGVKILKEEVESGNSAAAHLLAHYYSDKKLFEESDSYFTKAYELGRKSAALCQASEIFDHGRLDKKSLALELFNQNLEIILRANIPTKLEYAAILLWNDHIEEAQGILKEQVPLLPEIFEKQLEKETGYILAALTQYFALLISKGLTRLANSYFVNEEIIEFKQIIKPVYFALMHYMKKDYPSEFLKAGNELKDTVQEIIEKIEQYKKQI